MTLVKFKIPPDQNGYTFQDGNETIAEALDGGSSRYRKDILGANCTVNVQWTVSEMGYLYIREFYRVVTQSGSIPFLIDLLVDSAEELTEHTAYFIPGSLSLGSVSGKTHVIAASLEVKPIDVSELSGDYVYIYNEFGEDWEYWLDQLNTLTNETIPDDLS